MPLVAAVWPVTYIDMNWLDEFCMNVMPRFGIGRDRDRREVRVDAGAGAISPDCVSVGVEVVLNS
jgi:hypothetical protein